MTRPKLCHVFYAFNTGGPQTRAADIFNASDSQFHHTLVSLNGDFSCRDLLHRPERFDFVHAPRRRRLRPHLLVLAHMLRKIQPDLVVTYGWAGTDAVIAARLAGFRRIVHKEDGFLPDEVERQPLRRLLARRIILKGASRIVCPSDTLVRFARERWRVPHKKIRFIPNGVDMQRFTSGRPQDAPAVRQQMGCAADETLIGIVGRLSPEKNHARLLRAFAAIAVGRRVRLLIVGDGPMHETLRHQASELGIAQLVIFTGRIADPVGLYRAMDLCALSSDTEQMPIVLLEAMSRGVAVVSTDVGDVRAMLSPANRPFVVARANENAFAAALAELVDDEQKRESIGQANREHCRREYQLGPMVQAYVNLYQEVLAV